MGVEILGADTKAEEAKVIKEDETSIPETGSKTNSNSELGVEEPIQFGLVDSSHGVNGDTKETGHVAAANFPKDAVDEWPAPKEIHTFYFVRFRTYEDPKLKTKIEQVDKDIQKKNQARSQLIEALRTKRSERANLISQLKPLTSEDRGYRTVMDEKRKEMEPLRDALGQLRSVNNATREKGVVLCSSEEELNTLIQMLNFRIQHESNTLVEEKKMLKEIRQLEGSREKVIANAAMKAKIMDSVGPKEDLQDQVKLIGGDMDEVRKEKQAVRTKISVLDEELKFVAAEIKTLEEQLDAITKKREETYASLNELRKARDEVNVRFYQNRSLLNSAKDLAAKKDISALRELSHNEVETFMSQWSSSKDFRADYERRILSSLDSRQLSRDGRMRNPDEKPIVVPLPANEPATIPTKVTGKPAKEETLPPPRHDTTSMPKIEDKIEVQPRGKPARLEDTEDTYEIGKSKELPKPNPTDAAKSKEIKREEEIAKAKLALERKKKLAEKAAAKAAVRAQKEAEKKIKEKEKRAKKKAGVSEPAASDEQTEDTDAKSSEPEEAEVKLEAPVPAKVQDRKEKTKYRGRPRVLDPLPKVILKRKKSQSYWVWAAPAAAIFALVLAAVAYYYVGSN